MKRNQRTPYRSIFFLGLFIAIVIIVCAIFFNINIILRIILDIIGLLVLGVAAFFYVRSRSINNE
jgi:amino acid transporter